MTIWKITTSFSLPLLVLLLIPWCIHTWLEALAFHNLPSIGLGLVLVFVGLSFLAWTNALFVAYGNGTLAPWSPTQKLVILGPYRFVRNPMILAVVVILLGESVMFSSFYLFGWAMLFALINHLWFLFWEEPLLELKYGRAYSYYKQICPRWIPLAKPIEFDPDVK